MDNCDAARQQAGKSQANKKNNANKTQFLGVRINVHDFSLAQSDYVKLFTFASCCV
jgi:hypothetical protein